MKEVKTLKLTLNKKWFDLIEKGIKTEEYREIKPYWFSRLLYKIPSPVGGYFNASKDILIEMVVVSCSRSISANGLGIGDVWASKYVS